MRKNGSTRCKLEAQQWAHYAPIRARDLAGIKQVETKIEKFLKIDSKFLTLNFIFSPNPVKSPGP